MLRKAGVLLTVVAASTLSASPHASPCATKVGTATSSAVQWNEAASQDLAKALHHMHELANRGEIEALKELMIGDDVLATFELAGDNQTPIVLRSQAQIHQFVSDITDEAENAGGEFVLEIPRMHCRATSTFGVCTEECTVRFTTAKGERVDKLFGTAVAVKQENTWKWIQWHMSVGGPPQEYTYSEGELRRTK